MTVQEFEHDSGVCYQTESLDAIAKEAAVRAVQTSRRSNPAPPVNRASSPRPSIAYSWQSQTRRGSYGHSRRTQSSPLPPWPPRHSLADWPQISESTGFHPVQAPPNNFERYLSGKPFRPAHHSPLPPVPAKDE